MNPGAKSPAKKQQPRQSGMGGLCHLALDVEVEDRFGMTSTALGEALPTRLAGSGRTVSRHTIADEVNVQVILVGWPMLHEVLQEQGPGRGKTMTLEVFERERKAVINADQDARLMADNIP
jgi:hypothetical protein